MQQPYKYLKTRHHGQTLWVEVHNPYVNFIVTDMLEELFHLFRRVETDDAVRVVILTSGLENMYIMHFSIAELSRITLDNRKTGLNRMIRNRFTRFLLIRLLTLNGWLMDTFRFYETRVLKQTRLLQKQVPTLFLWTQMTRLHLAIERSNKITIAAINGPCNGGGVELSMCFDFRFMIGDQGYKLSQPECLIGIIPGGGSSQRLPRLIGRTKALEWMIRGNLITPQEARALGLITDVFDKVNFRKQVQAFADLMAKRPPVAVHAIKMAVHQGMDTTLNKGLVLELEQSVRCFDTRDAEKGIANYIALIQEKIDVPEENRINADELFDIMENARFVDGFNGK